MNGKKILGWVILLGLFIAHLAALISNAGLQVTALAFALAAPVGLLTIGLYLTLEN